MRRNTNNWTRNEIDTAVKALGSLREGQSESMIYAIDPYIGANGYRFGMTQAKVKKAGGVPSQTSEDLIMKQVAIHVVVHGKSCCKIWVDDRANDGGIYPDEYFGNTNRLHFLDWYELWLDLTLEELAESSPAGWGPWL